MILLHTRLRKLKESKNQKKKKCRLPTLHISTLWHLQSLLTCSQRPIYGFTWCQYQVSSVLNFSNTFIPLSSLSSTSFISYIYGTFSWTFSHIFLKNVHTYLYLNEYVRFPDSSTPSSIVLFLCFSSIYCFHVSYSFSIKRTTVRLLYYSLTLFSSRSPITSAMVYSTYRFSLNFSIGNFWHSWILSLPH